MKDELPKVQSAVEQKKHERELALKDAKRCGGTTTVSLVMALSGVGSARPKDTHGCRYMVFGKVVSSNKSFVQIEGNPGYGTYPHLLRTSEAFVDGTLFMGGNARYASFEGIEHVELADGSSHALPVFKLLK